MTRKGMSVAEVLVALFLLALGTLAILTMFPLGMYHMSLALKDDRTAQSAQQADAVMRMYWRTNVVENASARFPAQTGYPGYEPAVLAFDHPDWYADFSAAPIPPYDNPNTAPGPPPVGGTPIPRRGTAGLPDLRNAATHSYPVFVDPMGFATNWNILNATTYDLRYWVGGQAYGRRTLNAFLTSASRPGALWSPHRTCSLMDGFGFAENGAPSTTGGAVDRELRYNWMWILQRPDNTMPNTATMTVVAFDKRSFQFAPQNAEQVFATQYPNQFPFYTAPASVANTIVMQPLLTTVSVPVGLGIPPVQKGGWLMDSTYLPPGNPYAGQFGMRHAIFYRVVSVTDNTATTGFTDIELQTPIRRMDGGTGAYPGTLMHFTGVSEVFDRPNLTSNDF